VYLLQLGLEQLSGRDTPHPDHAQTTGRSDGGSEPATGDSAHRRVDDGYPQAQTP
jgi:hypothetical protein